MALTSIEIVLAALDDGRLVANMHDVKGQLRACASAGSWKDPDGHVLRAAPELIDLLAGLLEPPNRMTIMSLFRFKSPHGKVQPDGTGLGRAVDIMAYAGIPIHLKLTSNVQNAIAGVTAVLRNLPAGKYTLGLPRPGGGALIDPAHDVFFSVTDHAQVTKSPGKGVFQKDIELVLEPARAAMKEALGGNPTARIQYMYPDGVDHLHVEALA